MSRELRISTVCFPFQPGEPHTVDAHLAHTETLVSRAAGEGAQLVVLPEIFAMIGDPSTDNGCQGDVTGQTTAFMGQLAARHGLCIVSSTYERHGERKHVVANVIGADGQEIGRHIKAHLAPGEGAVGLTPGDALEVVDLGVAKAGIIICMEIHYPEMPRIYALQGAEILLWPTSGHGFNTELLEVLFRSRCVDNQMIGVTANYGCLPFMPGNPSGQTYIVGFDGQTLADTGHRPGVATATVDLDAGYPMWYQQPLLDELPTLRETVMRTRRPELYGGLTEPMADQWRPGIDPEPSAEAIVTDEDDQGECNDE